MSEGDLVAFVQLVAGMRLAQKACVLRRSHEALRRATDFEGLVDTALLGLMDPEPEPALPQRDTP